MYLLGVKKAFLVPGRVVSLKRTPAGASAVPYRVLSHFVLEVHVTLVHLRGGNISSHAQKTRSWCPFGILFKNFNEHSQNFNMGVPPVPTPRIKSPLLCTNFHNGANEFFLHLHCHAIQTHFHRKGCAPGLVFKLRKHSLRTLVVSLTGAKETRPLGMRILVKTSPRKPSITRVLAA